MKHSFIAKEGYPFILLALALFVGAYWAHPLLGVPFGGLLAFVVYFFRNPKRVLPLDDHALIAPADGKIIFAGPVSEERFLKQPAQKISIFMSPFNVHVNRVPVGGCVEQVSYNKGKFFPAYAEKSSLDNEQNAIVIRTDQGEKVLFIQIAGWLARRIVSYIKPGQIWKQGHIFGMIRFGSRMDIYFPLKWELKACVGERTKAGETILARRIS